MFNFEQAKTLFELQLNAEAMLNIYNKRLRYPLHVSKLYNKKRVTLPDFIENGEEIPNYYDYNLGESEEFK